MSEQFKQHPFDGRGRPIGLREEVRQSELNPPFQPGEWIAHINDDKSSPLRPVKVISCDRRTDWATVRWVVTCQDDERIREFFADDFMSVEPPHRARPTDCWQIRVIEDALTIGYIKGKSTQNAIRFVLELAKKQLEQVFSQQAPEAAPNGPR